MANLRIKSFVSYSIPYFGNAHTMPFFTIVVTDGTTTQTCKSKGDKVGDKENYQYITFKRKRYKVTNKGTLYTPNLQFTPV